MAQNETPITIVGNLVEDPSLRFTPSGAAVANFRVASTPRVYNKDSGKWDDGEALFLTVNVWRQAAENVAESLSKGMRVIVYGALKQRSYQTKEGEQRTVFEVEADEVAPSLKFASAQVNRNPREGGGGQSFGQQPQQGQAATYNPVQAQSTGNGWGGQQAPQQQQQGQQQSQGGDPWNSAPQGGFGGAQDEVPF